MARAKPKYGVKERDLDDIALEWVYKELEAERTEHDRAFAPMPRLTVDPPREREFNTVYFAATDDGVAVKIGVTSNVLRRLAAIRQGMHVGLTLVGTVKGDDAVERAFHERFAAYRSKGEWFRVEGELKTFLDQMREARLKRT